MARHQRRRSAAQAATRANWDVVGPVCESADFLAHDRDLTLAEGTLLAICSAGAYGFVQSSNYNSRNRAAEVLVDGASFSIVRRRETMADQLRAEVASSAPEETPQSAAPLQYRVLIDRLLRMQIQFSKMHGLGNDFMVIDQISQDVRLSPELIARLSDRHTGIGFDQLLSVEPPTDPESDFRYRIYNADGSEAEQCGNGARCFAKFVVDNGLSVKTELRLQTNNGVITTQLRDDGTVEVDMGVPTTEPERDPVRHRTNRRSPIASPSAVTKLDVVPVSVGNPHAVLFVDSVNDAPVATLGPLLSRHERFPRGVNVGFCQVIDPGFARLRVFERGVGETRACGTGACAAAVAGMLTGQFSERVKISLPGRQSQNQMGRRRPIAADARSRLSRL